MQEAGPVCLGVFQTDNLTDTIDRQSRQTAASNVQNSAEQSVRVQREQRAEVAPVVASSSYNAACTGYGQKGELAMPPIDQPDKDFAALLKEYRHQAGLTQDALGQAIRVDG